MYHTSLGSDDRLPSYGVPQRPSRPGRGGFPSEAGTQPPEDETQERLMRLLMSRMRTDQQQPLMAPQPIPPTDSGGLQYLLSRQGPLQDYYLRQLLRGGR